LLNKNKYDKILIYIKILSISMLKSDSPGNIWNEINTDLWMLRVESTVDETLTKFFWIIWTNTSKRYAFSKWLRICNNCVRSVEYNWTIEWVSWAEIINQKSVKEFIDNKMNKTWLSIEPFLEYFLEKYSWTKIWLPPAEMDSAHKVDFVIPSWKIKFWLDIKVWRNWANKRKKTKEHAINIDDPNYIPNTINEWQNKEEFLSSTLNTDNFSKQFLYHTNWIIRINWNSKITKSLDKEEIFKKAYKWYIKNNWEKQIENYLKQDIIDELAFIAKSVPKALNYLINFLKHGNLTSQNLSLPKKSWKVHIHKDPTWKFVEIKLFQWKKSNSYCDLFIPITDKLLKKIL